jgi:hypothetical protein
MPNTFLSGGPLSTHQFTMAYTGKTSDSLCAFIAFASVMPVAVLATTVVRSAISHPDTSDDLHLFREVREEPEPAHPVHMTGQRVGHGHRYSTATTGRRVEGRRKHELIVFRGCIHPIGGIYTYSGPCWASRDYC